MDWVQITLLVVLAIAVVGAIGSMCAMFVVLLSDWPDTSPDRHCKKVVDRG